MTNNFGLTEIELKQLRAVFAKYIKTGKVIIYGSRARGDFRDNSDIDLTIMDDSVNSKTLAKLESDLDDLLLPYSIDLSLLGNIENENLKKKINEEGVDF